MAKNFLDYTGLTKYTEKLEDFILSKLTGLVPNTRTINDKPLSSDITLTAEDVNARPNTWSPDLSGYVPTTRTVNGKPLTSDITLTAEDVGASSVDLSGYVPTTRTVNGKALSSDITLSASDVGARSSSWNPDLSAYAPKASPVFTGTISLGRKSGDTVGSPSIAIGTNVSATEANSVAMGNGAVASNLACISLGSSTTASGIACFAEGASTTAIYQYSHAEGHKSKASGKASHAEGSNTEASGNYAHAEGYVAIASGESAHAQGEYTIASNYASTAIGKYNKAMTDGGAFNDQVGDVFVVGNGTGLITSSTGSNALRLAYEGTLYLTKAYNSTGADYAEYFEWLDGNPDNEDRVGRFVTLEGDKIKLAQEGDYILGVISGQPCVIGNADEDWLGRWEHDDFNRFVKEYLVHTETEVFQPDDVANAANPDEALQNWLIKNNVTERDGHYYQTTTEVVDYPTTSWRHKANPAYDPSQSYIERKDRQEWDAVGMVGVLSVIDDGSCVVNGYAKVSPNGIATKADTLEYAKTWRVIGRVSDHTVKIVFSI